MRREIGREKDTRTHIQITYVHHCNKTSCVIQRSTRTRKRKRLFTSPSAHQSIWLTRCSGCIWRFFSLPSRADEPWLWCFRCGRGIEEPFSATKLLASCAGLSGVDGTDERSVSWTLFRRCKKKKGGQIIPRWSATEDDSDISRHMLQWQQQGAHST